MKKYKVKYKVEKIYNVEVEIEDPVFPPAISDHIYEIITEDYQVGNMDNDEVDETYSIENIKEIK